MRQFSVIGMSCAACSTRVEKAVAKVEGVTSVSVSLLTNSMSVDGSALTEDIISAVEAAGYHAMEKVTGIENISAEGNGKSEDNETRVLVRRLIISVVLTGILMYFSMGYVMWGWPVPGFLKENPVAQGILQMILAGAVMILNRKFFINGFQGLMHRAPNMDTLVALCK